jgi:hypothetical protein
MYIFKSISIRLDPDPDPHFNADPDPGQPNECGSGSTTLTSVIFVNYISLLFSVRNKFNVNLLLFKILIPFFSGVIFISFFRDPTDNYGKVAGGKSTKLKTAIFILALLQT